MKTANCLIEFIINVTDDTVVVTATVTVVVRQKIMIIQFRFSIVLSCFFTINNKQTLIIKSFNMTVFLSRTQTIMVYLDFGLKTTEA